MKDFNMNRFFVDTNIFIRIIDASNKQMHKDSIEFIDAIRDSRLDSYTSGIVLSEIVWTLKSFYKLEKKEIIEVIDSISAINNIKIINLFDLNRCLEIYKNNKIKYIDCQIASLNKITKEKIPIVTFDKEFKKIKGIKSLTPREALNLYFS